MNDALQRRPAAVGLLHDQRPRRVLRRPGRGDDLVLEADVAIDVVLGRRLLDIGDDRRAFADRLRMLPRLEAVAHGVHVAVGADARIAEQIPGAAHARLGLQDREGLARQPGLQVARGADAGEPRANNNDVKPFACHGGSCLLNLKILARQQANIRPRSQWRPMHTGMPVASSIWRISRDRSPAMPPNIFASRHPIG